MPNAFRIRKKNKSFTSSTRCSSARVNLNSDCERPNKNVSRSLRSTTRALSRFSKVNHCLSASNDKQRSRIKERK